MSMVYFAKGKITVQLVYLGFEPDTLAWASILAFRVIVLKACIGHAGYQFTWLRVGKYVLCTIQCSLPTQQSK